MLPNYFLVTLRSMMKNKVFIILNVVGMGLAIGNCLIAYYIYDYNITFNSNHRQAPTIYRVSSMREFQNEVTRYGYAPLALGNAIRENVPSVDRVVRYNPYGVDFRLGTEVFNTEMAYVDADFFKVFTIDMMEGTPPANINQLVLNEEVAAKYFKNESAVGKMLTQVLDSGKTREFMVSGVFRRQPNNSSFDKEAFLPFESQYAGLATREENNWKLRTTLYVQVTDASRIPAIEQQLKSYAANNNKVREDFIIREFDVEPFEGIGIRDSFNSVPGVWTARAAPASMTYGTAVMGFLVVLIACFNLTNTAIAVSSRRLKEIGIRKVMGSSRFHLIGQFMSETLFICLLAMVFGIAVGEFALVPGFNALWTGMKLDPDYFGRPAFLIFTSVGLLFVALMAGSYPSLYISQFQPTTILKGKLKFGGTTMFSRVLLAMQFTISIIAIVCSIAFVDNARFQRDYDLGFNQYGIAYSYVRNHAEFEQLRNRLLQNPDVTSIAASTHHVGTSFINDPIKFEDKEIEVDIFDVGDDYLKTAGLTLISGRDFIKDSETDKRESIIVTETLAEQLGWKEPLGKEIRWMDTTRYIVVGVIKTVFNQGLWRKVEPMMLRYSGGKNTQFIVVSAPLTKIKSVRENLEAIHRELFPDRIARIRLMEEVVVQATEVNNNILTMFLFTGLVALLLSTSGLFTLVSLSIIKKMKEIGVRKVFGASAANLVRVINAEFFLVLGLSVIAGAAAGGWTAGMLMGSIWEYYQKTTGLTIVISVAVMVGIAIITVAHKILTTVKVNPATVLRDE
ncbi:MAG: ABC transporter permease [Cyclobacteriaceae bacterium]|nr:ABC transporter permease [Cyclobacteriaceae bacterium]